MNTNLTNVGLQSKTYVLADVNTDAGFSAYQFERVQTSGDYIALDPDYSSGIVEIILNVEQPQNGIDNRRITLKPGAVHIGAYTGFVMQAGPGGIAAGLIYYGNSRSYFSQIAGDTPVRNTNLSNSESGATLRRDVFSGVLAGATNNSPGGTNTFDLRFDNFFQGCFGATRNIISIKPRAIILRDLFATFVGSFPGAVVGASLGLSDAPSPRLRVRGFGFDGADAAFFNNSIAASSFLNLQNFQRNFVVNGANQDCIDSIVYRSENDFVLIPRLTNAGALTFNTGNLTLTCEYIPKNTVGGIVRSVPYASVSTSASLRTVTLV